MRGSSITSGLSSLPFFLICCLGSFVGGLLARLTFASHNRRGRIDQLDHLVGDNENIARSLRPQLLIPCKLTEEVGRPAGKIERSDIAFIFGPGSDHCREYCFEIGIHVGALDIGKLVVGRVIFHRKHDHHQIALHFEMVEL